MWTAGGWDFSRGSLFDGGKGKKYNTTKNDGYRFARFGSILEEKSMEYIIGKWEGSGASALQSQPSLVAPFAKHGHLHSLYTILLCKPNFSFISQFIQEISTPDVSICQWVNNYLIHKSPVCLIREKARGWTFTDDFIILLWRWYLEIPKRK